VTEEELQGRGAGGGRGADCMNVARTEQAAALCGRDRGDAATALPDVKLPQKPDIKCCSEEDEQRFNQNAVTMQADAA